MPAVDTLNQPYWILFFAHMLGSLGVGASILAGWLLWIIPVFIKKPEIEEPWVLIERPARPRGNRNTNDILVPSVSPSSRPPSPAFPSIQNPVSSRRVSFRIPPPIRVPPTSDAAAEVNSLATVSNGSSSPSSTNYTSSFISSACSYEEPHDITTTSHPSRQLPHRLLRSLLAKRKDSTTSYESEPETTLKGSNSFWSRSRRLRINENETTKSSRSFFQRRVSLTISTRPPSPSPSAIRSPPKGSTPFYLLSRKSESRRQSIPPARPRTEPYGAPYFAAPPQSSGDVFYSEQSRISTESVPVRGRQALRKHTAPSAPRRPIVKRRSASTSRAMTSMQL